MPNCSTCIEFGPECVDINPKCQECYFTTDDNGIRTKPNHKPKLKQHFHKVTRFSKEQKIAICSEKMSLQKIAEKYRTSPTTVYKIRKMSDLYVN